MSPFAQMSESVEFVIRGKIDGVEITPESINLTLFNDFNQQVEKFVAGSVGGGGGRRLLLDQVFVSIRKGSYCLRTEMSVPMLKTVEPELRLLARPGGMDRVDEGRAGVVEKWQMKAKAHEDLTYELRVVRADGSFEQVVQIGPTTNFVRRPSERWKRIETHLLGEIVDMGGEDPNVHIRLLDTGETVIVTTDKETLRGLQRNMLYERAVLHVVGEQNTDTGRHRYLRLLEFVNYNPRYEEGELDAFIQKGREAWADVPDASDWVRKHRGES